MKHTIYNMDVLKALKQLPDESIDCVVTSPPYYSLRFYQGADTVWGGDPNCEHEFKSTKTARPNASGGHNSDKLAIKGTENFQESVDYNDRRTESNVCGKCGAFKGQLGLESTYSEYLGHLMLVTKELKRALKKTGSLFLNMGDSYSGSWQDYGSREGGQREKNVEAFKRNGNPKSFPLTVNTGIPNKSLMLIPERFAIKMVDEGGWLLRNFAIWYSGNKMPSSVRDRLSNKWEAVFFMTKNGRYYFDLDAIRKRLSEDIMERNNSGQPIGTQLTLDGKEPEKLVNQETERLSETKAFFNSIGSGGNPVENHYNENGANPGDVFDMLPHNGANTGANNKEPYKQNNPHLMRLKQSNYQGKISKSEAESFGSPRARELRDSYNGDKILNGANPGDVFSQYSTILGNAQLMDAFVRWLETDTPELLMPQVFDVNTHPHPFGHFAVFPEALITPMLESGCPKEVCSKCGKPKMPSYERNDKFTDEISETSTLHTDAIQETKTVWKPSCKCGVDFIPGTVLDPFAGSGTVATVARRLGLNSVSIEVVPKYVDIIKDRVGFGSGFGIEWELKTE